MTSDDSIIIHRMIVHKIDHRNYDTPGLSDMESPIPVEVCSFLRQHIISNREHKYTRNAKFIDPPDNELVLRNIFKILIDNDQFIEQSKVIAEYLFKKMKRTKTISPGDLIICTFSEGSNDSKWLAILKVDPEDGFVGEREVVNGQIRIVLKRVEGVLPTGELQKCAFIVPKESRKSVGYDLKVLDQQASRYGAKQLVASFFITDFLQCKVGLNPVDRTRVFVYASREWIEKKKWPEDEKNQFKKRISEVIQDKIVDSASVAQAVISLPTEQDEYLSHLKDKGLEELTFEPDPEERRRLMQYVWYEGDNGLRIRIDNEAVGPGKTLEYVRDDNTNTWIITIRTTQWQDQIRRGR